MTTPTQAEIDDAIGRATAAGLARNQIPALVDLIRSVRADAMAEAQSDAKDAARYRKLRGRLELSDWNRLGHYAADALDAQVDALAAPPQPSPSRGGEG